MNISYYTIDDLRLPAKRLLRKLKAAAGINRFQHAELSRNPRQNLPVYAHHLRFIPPASAMAGARISRALHFLSFSRSGFP